MRASRKKTTVLIDLSTLGVLQPVPVEQGEEREAALRHNAAVRAWRAMEAAALAQAALNLSFVVHVGHDCVLLRGLEERAMQIEVPSAATVRDASDRWTPAH